MLEIVVVPFSLLNHSCRVSHRSLSVASVSFPLPLEAAPVDPCCQALAVAFVVDPVAFVFGPVLICVCTLTVPSIILELTMVDMSIIVDLTALPILFPFVPVPFVNREYFSSGY